MKSPLIECLEPRQVLSAIALFDDPAYVDTDATDPTSSEPDNLRAVLEAAGHVVTPLVGISAASIATGLAAQEVLVVPALQIGDLAADLSDAALDVIRGFVASGGGVVIAGDDNGTSVLFSRNVALLNGLLESSVRGGFDVTSLTSTLNAGGVAGTAFAAGPATLPNHDLTHGIDPSTLPSTARVLYTSPSVAPPEVSVLIATGVLFPHECGQVVYLGWDWLNSDPPNVDGNDGGWNEVLDRAVDQITTPAADRFDAGGGDNDSQAAAVVLGSEPTVTLDDLSIHDAADDDWFRITAHDTGKIIVNQLFAAQFGQLDLQIRDGGGNVIAVGTANADGKRAVIEAVGLQSYFIQASGDSGGTNCYALEIENFPAPVPGTPRLDPASDTGTPRDDAVTANPRPRILVPADIGEFAVGSLDILIAAEAEAGQSRGVAVFVTLIDIQSGNAITGFANPINGSGTLFAFTPVTSLPDATYIVRAAVQIFDARQQGDPPSPTPATGRSLLSDNFLLTIDTTPPATQTPDLLASSDSGMFNDDNVTNKMQPAFDGVGEANSLVRVFAQRNGNPMPLLVGQGVVGTDATDGVPDDGLGLWELTAEPMIDGTYAITVQFEDQAGNLGLVTDPALSITIDTERPNTPALDLVEASDGGRSNVDDVSNDNTPDVRSTSEDPIATGDAVSVHFVKYRIFDRFNGNAEALLINNTTLQAPAAFLDTLPLLADGVHNLKLEFEDVAGNISDDFLLSVVIDTIAPPVFFGLTASATDGLDPASDTGVAGQPATISDRITSVTVPRFFGTAEANAVVRLFANSNAAGLTVATPTDGNGAFPSGQWSLQSTFDLNSNPPFTTLDGLRNMTATAEDLAGNVSTPASLDVFIDTQGPQVGSVFITSATNFDVFDPKPSVGPTPLVSSMSIIVRDFPSNVTQFLRNALAENPLPGEFLGDPAENPGNYIVRGDHNGIIPIAGVAFNAAAAFPGQSATGTLVITFASPLPDDRFTLTVSDNLVDPAGNQLDGESNASTPQEIPLFPSGDGAPGGDFVARFTVDSRPELGTYAAQSIFIDINGNQFFDPEGQDGDFTNRDLVFTLGSGGTGGFQIHDGLIAGNFAQLAGGVDDGFDKFAAYGFINGAFRWLVDFTNDGVPDLNQIDPAAINGLPFAGEFDGNAANGDEVGLFDGSSFLFDTNHDFRVDLASRLVSSLRGTPVVGDFDGNGVDDLATLHVDQFQFDLAGAAVRSFNGTVDATIAFGFPGVQELPLAADMDGDGIDDVGLWVPRRSGQVVPEEAEWYFLVSNDPTSARRVTGTVGTLNHSFEPVPFGADLFMRFGDEFALPVVGNFDPPLTSAAPSSSWTNRADSLDVDGDGQIVPLDALIVMNQLDTLGAVRLTTYNATGATTDVNADGELSPLDALMIINHLDSGLSSLAAEVAAPSPLDPALADAVLAAADLDGLLDAALDGGYLKKQRGAV